MDKPEINFPKLPACMAKGCWETHTKPRGAFGACNTHKVQQQPWYAEKNPGFVMPELLSGEAFAAKATARSVSADVAAYRAWVESNEGSALSADIEKRRKRVVAAHVDGLYGKVNVRRKREKGDEGARKHVPAKGKCFVCGDESAPGASCLNSKHFICGDCVDGQHVAWKNSYPLRLVNGIRCASENCDSAYDNRELRACMSNESDAIRMLAYASKIQMQAKAEALDRARKDSLQMTVSVWLLDRSTESAVAKLRAYVEDDILMNKCPRCALPFGDFTACTAVACESDIAGQDQGNGVEACGAFFCAWCLGVYDSNKECHRHVLECPERIVHGDFFAEDGEYSECLRKRRAAKIADLQGHLPPALFEGLRETMKDTLQEHNLY